MCYYLSKEIFYFMFLSFKLYHLSVMKTANTHWVVIVYQVLGQVISMLTHLILRIVFCNRYYTYPHFTNDKMKKKESHG